MDIDRAIDQWQVEEALELAFLATERVSVAALEGMLDVALALLDEAAAV